MPKLTTAEAFATVRAVLHPLQHDGAPVPSPRADAALSLLERRMGALDAVGRRLAAGANNREVWDALDAALTDVPPVFTLGEVEQALRSVHGKLAMTEGVRAYLATLRQ